jgi:hypothetical protein
VVFYNGDAELAPGLTVHATGGDELKPTRVVLADPRLVIVEAIEMDQQLHVALETEQRILGERVEGRERDASAHKPVVHQLVLLGVSGFAIVASRAHGAGSATRKALATR